MGKNVMNWSLNRSGKLTISGEGKIPDYVGKERYSAPWNDCKDKISEIVIEGGITEIGVNAFRECRNLKKVTFPDTLFRIHAYAFWGCVNLRKVKCNHRDIVYYYDTSFAYDEYVRWNRRKQTALIFSLGAFYAVPWCREKWGDFYIKNDELYICFSDDDKIQIPEGVRVIKKNAFFNICAEKLVLPESMEVIEDFAFYKASIGQEMRIEKKNMKMEPYAFVDADTMKFSVPHNWKDPELKSANVEYARRKYYPKYIDRYTVAGKKSLDFEGFRKLEVVERKTIFHQDGQVTRVREGGTVLVGEKMLRRLNNGQVLFGITYKNDRVIAVNVLGLFTFTDDLSIYRLEPIVNNDGSVLISTESVEDLGEKDILKMFDERDGKFLKKEKALRKCPPAQREEWFSYTFNWKFDRKLPLKFLREWLECHPEIIG